MSVKKGLALISILVVAFVGVVAATQYIKSQIRTVTVQEYTLTLEVDPDTCFVGDQVTFSGTLSLDGTPVEGETVTLYFAINDTSTGLTDVTEVDGSYAITWTAPHKGTVDFYTQTTIT